MTVIKNKFCKQSDLRNESDVEQFFVSRLLQDLAYTDTNILTKPTIREHSIGKRDSTRKHRPDYQICIKKIPVLIIEAKHPKKPIDKYIGEAQDYASVTNREFIGKNPIQYVLVTNGIKTKLAKTDENKVLLDLNFKDFVINNQKYKKLKDYISLDSIKNSPPITKKESFEFKKPDIGELKGIFKQAHDLIWQKQKIGPKKAFYEFTKLLFVKMNEDKNIQEMLDAKKKVTIDDFKFSVNKIENTDENWIKKTLFEKYRDKFEILVGKREKKRIFQKNEKINLNPSTIKIIVDMIENFNLRSVEDDINGKVFETFLEAAVRGKELGQFFTPRSVVKFMVQMAELKIKKENGSYKPEAILDGSCGTGGFLIFALSELFRKIPDSCSNKKKLKKKIKEEALFGIDASDDDIIPITRMNMYLHGDGGSHIFLADTLDKDLLIEEGLDGEKKEEKKELKNLLKSKKFDVVLTNPPFSMKYRQEQKDEQRILQHYEIASLSGKPTRSLKSNLMFFERYHDLLKPGGKLLTVIDESVLNTEGQGKIMQKFRKWLREKFIIRAIVSLPRNTFINADAGVKTSVLYLTKRESPDEEQPPIFMAISENVGHNDAGRITSEMGDLVNILNSFKRFQNGKY